MNSKERMLIALHGGKPDRLPVTVHQWQQYHLDTFMGGITPLEAFAVTGMDASIQYFTDMGQFWLPDADFTKFSTPGWQDEIEIISDDPDNRIYHHTITTPGGNLTYKTAGNRMTTWITEYLIKQAVMSARPPTISSRRQSKICASFLMQRERASIDHECVHHPSDDSDSCSQFIRNQP